MVRIVIIGSGDIAKKRHIPGILQTSNGEIAGYYNRSRERSEAAAAQWGGKVYSSPEEIWKDPEADAVLVAVPTPAHYPLVMDALRAGKHVLCEKPLALNKEEAKAMVKEAEKQQKKLMVCHVQRLYAPHEKARELIRDGVLGKILTFRTFLGVKGGAAVDGKTPWKNAVAELGTHRIDLMRYLLGAEAKRAFGCLVRLEETSPETPAITGEDNAFCLVEYEGGIYGMMGFSRTSYGASDRTTWIYGTEGAMTIYGEQSALRLDLRDGRRLDFDFPVEDQKKLEITRIHQMFCDCVEQDTEPAISGEDGLAAMRLVDALRKSQDAGGWVPVEGKEETIE